MKKKRKPAPSRSAHTCSAVSEKPAPAAPAGCLNPTLKHVDVVPEGENLFEIDPGYFKAGNDLSFHVEQCDGDTVAGLQHWGLGLLASGGLLVDAALALQGCNVTVEVADNHMALLSAEDEAARQALRGLALADPGVVAFSYYQKCGAGNGFEYSGPDEEDEL